MTLALDPSEIRLTKYDWHRTAVLLLIPVLLAAGMMEPSPTDPALPEAGSFRTPLPDAIFESSRWRTPQPENRDWRLPPPTPPVGWRTPQDSPAESSSSRRTIEIFPQYKSGNPSDFDMTDREEKPLIKLFEFGSK